MYAKAEKTCYGPTYGDDQTEPLPSAKAIHHFDFSSVARGGPWEWWLERKAAS